MQEFNLAQFIILTVLQYLGIALYIFTIKRIKIYTKRITTEDNSMASKLNRTKKIMFYTHFFISVIMIVKTNYENKVGFRDVCKLFWFVDVVVLSYFAFSFVWKVYKYGWG